jgi:hypothetical protein
MDMTEHMSRCPILACLLEAIHLVWRPVIQ